LLENIVVTTNLPSRPIAGAPHPRPTAGVIQPEPTPPVQGKKVFTMRSKVNEDTKRLSDVRINNAFANRYYFLSSGLYNYFSQNRDIRDQSIVYQLHSLPPRQTKFTRPKLPQFVEPTQKVGETPEQFKKRRIDELSDFFMQYRHVIHQANDFALVSKSKLEIYEDEGIAQYRAYLTAEMKKLQLLDVDKTLDESFFSAEDPIEALNNLTDDQLKKIAKLFTNGSECPILEAIIKRLPRAISEYDPMISRIMTDMRERDAGIAKFRENDQFYFSLYTGNCFAKEGPINIYRAIAKFNKLFNLTGYDQNYATHDFITLNQTINALLFVKDEDEFISFFILKESIRDPRNPRARPVIRSTLVKDGVTLKGSIADFERELRAIHRELFAKSEACNKLADELQKKAPTLEEKISYLQNPDLPLISGTRFAMFSHVWGIQRLRGFDV
jgi:hypothetical protein